MKYIFLFFILVLSLLLSACSSRVLVPLNPQPMICNESICVFDSSVKLNSLEVKNLRDILRSHESSSSPYNDTDALLYRPTDDYRADEIKNDNFYILVNDGLEVLVEKENGKWVSKNAFHFLQ